jgi:methanogenic corrinoid protein MtbC1
MTNQLMQDYLQALLAGDQEAAQKNVMDAFRDGVPTRQIYLDIFQPALYQIGSLWEIGRISVAQEHLATAITQTVLANIYAEIEFQPSRNETAIIGCLENNYHEMGARMVADFLQIAGYDATFMGAGTPTNDFLSMIDQTKPSVVGLPATFGYQTDLIKQAIEQIRSDFASYRPTILVGGIAFNLTDGLWKSVGGDVWGKDAGEAVDHLVG